MSPVFAESFEESARVLQCEQSNSADEKANCYKEFARSYYDAQQSIEANKEHNRLNSGNYVKRKNGNVERKKAKDYAKDSAIAGAANANSRMAVSGGYSYCDFHNMPGETNNILINGFPSIEAGRRCEAVNIAACKEEKKGKARQKCKMKWDAGLAVFMRTKEKDICDTQGQQGNPSCRERKKYTPQDRPRSNDNSCEELRRGKINPNAAHYNKLVENCKG